ncbi:MAG: metal-dependent hydrolase [Ruminococcus sp.]|nr:metal-dependent hydrolase [Ruminococcus sp.]
MMGKTHIFIGTATALAFTLPDSPMKCLTAVMGGALGGMISDTDLDSLKNIKETMYTKSIAGLIAAICLLIDFIFKCGIIEYMKSSDSMIMLAGLVAFIVLYFIGAAADHRGFTHSIFALLLYSAAIGAMCYPVALPFAIGFGSHILLDCLNKKPVRVFFPVKKGICFKLCYAAKTANQAFLVVGIISTILLLGFSIVRISI